MNELAQRTISGVVLAAVVLLISWWHLWAFGLMVIVGTAILLAEWRNLTAHRHIVFAPVGFLYIGLAAISLIALRRISFDVVMGLFLLVWTGDIAAYLVGKSIGKHRIAPRISPKKTWEGLGGAILATIAVAYFLLDRTSFNPPSLHLWLAILVGTIIAVVGLVGDLFESSLKRQSGLKDSGHLIPGHGGLFDRVDALLPCAILAAIALTLLANRYP